MKIFTSGGGFSQASVIHQETPYDLSYPERYKSGFYFDLCGTFTSYASHFLPKMGQIAPFQMPIILKPKAQIQKYFVAFVVIHHSNFRHHLNQNLWKCLISPSGTLCNRLENFMPRLALCPYVTHVSIHFGFCIFAPKP